MDQTGEEEKSSLVLQAKAPMLAGEAKFLAKKMLYHIHFNIQNVVPLHNTAEA